MEQAPGGREADQLDHEHPRIDSGPSSIANPFWQALNTKIGLTLVIEMAPNADYGTKFETKIASGDLPDLINIPDQHAGSA